MKDAHLLAAIEQSPFHRGLAIAETTKRQIQYRSVIATKVIARAVRMVRMVTDGGLTGRYRVAINEAKKIIALMERISED